MLCQQNILEDWSLFMSLKTYSKIVLSFICGLFDKIQTGNIYRQPHLVQELESHCIVQIACGNKAAFALSSKLNESI